LPTPVGGQFFLAGDSLRQNGQEKRGPAYERPLEESLIWMREGIQGVPTSPDVENQTFDPERIKLLFQAQLILEKACNRLPSRRVLG